MTLLKVIRLNCLIVFYLLIVLQSACSNLSSKAPEPQLNYDEELSQEDFREPTESEARYLFIRGELALKRDDYKGALSYFEEAQEKSSVPSPTISKRLAQIYIREGQLEDALKAAEEMEKAGGHLTESYKLKAGILNALGRTEEAISVYKQIVQNAELGDEEPYLLLSGAYIQNSRFSEAILVLEDLVNKKPDSFIASYYLAKLYASQRQFEKSLKYYQKSLALNSSAEQVHLEYIKVLVLSQNLSEAIKEGQKLVNQNPENEKAKELLTELLLGEKKIEMALSDFEEAKKSGQDSVDLQFKVALIKLQQRDFKGAEAELNLILSKKPDFDEAHYYLATAFASQDRLSAAVKELLKISPKSELYRKGRGFAAFLLRQDQKYDEALKVIKEGLNNFPDDLELLGYKTSIEKESGDLTSAIETLRKISNLEPENEQHLFNLGVILEEAKKPEEALAVIEKVLVKNPQHANALNYIAYSLAEKSKDLERAKKLIERALDIEKDNGFFLDTLGWIYFQLGEFSEAIPHLEKSAAITNGDAVILEHLGQAYIKLERYSEATHVLRQALEKVSNSTEESDQKLKIKIEEALKTFPVK